MAAALAVAICSCQSEAEHFLSEQHTIATGSNKAETRSLPCGVTTTAIGQLGSQLDNFAAANGCQASDITELVLTGPVSKADLKVLRPLNKLTKLDLSDMLMMDDNGENQMDYLPSRALDSLQGPAHLLLPLSVRQLEYELCRDSQIKSVTMPSNIESSYSGIFQGCKELESVQWSENLHEIPYYCFNGCEKLQFEIPNHVTEIRASAFQNCKALTSIRIPASVTYIDGWAFAYCSNLEAVSWESPYSIIPYYCFYDCPKLQFEIPGHIKEIQNGAFSYCSSLVHMTIPSSVTTLGDGVFAHCELLESVTWNDKLTDISPSTFFNCPKLQFDIPSWITSIGNGAFQNCDSITSFHLPEGLQTIGEEAFTNNESITELTIPASVTSVGRNIVSGCRNLKVIYWNCPIFIPRLSSWSTSESMLTYAPPGVAYDKNNYNLIFGNDQTGYTCEAFVCKDGVDYFCPKGFTAKKVVYRKEFNGWTSIGTCRNWKTICLPFTVTRYIAQATNNQPVRELAPFKANQNGTKPFWLRELTAEGFVSCATLEAGKPYIICMPNDESYDPEYNIEGIVEFWGENVQMIPHSEAKQAAGNGYYMVSTFQSIKKSPEIFHLNLGDYKDATTNTYHFPGSVFIANVHDTKPYEAYLKATSSTRTFFPITSAQASTRSTRPAGAVPTDDDL